MLWRKIWSLITTGCVDWMGGGFKKHKIPSSTFTGLLLFYHQGHISFWSSSPKSANSRVTARCLESVVGPSKGPWVNIVSACGKIIALSPRTSSLSSLSSTSSSQPSQSTLWHQLHLVGHQSVIIYWQEGRICWGSCHGAFRAHQIDLANLPPRVGSTPTRLVGTNKRVWSPP